MGHIRLGTLPATRKWREVVGLVSGGAPPDLIAGASASAAEAALRHARDDPALLHSFWLLTQLPLAARAPDFLESLGALGLRIDRDPSLLEIVGALNEAPPETRPTTSRHFRVAGRVPSRMCPIRMVPSSKKTGQCHTVRRNTSSYSCTIGSAQILPVYLSKKT